MMMTGSAHSSEQFGSAMGVGWRDALKFQFPDVKVLCDTKIKRYSKETA
jgi:hypothetical protein